MPPAANAPATSRPPVAGPVAPADLLAGWTTGEDSWFSAGGRHLLARGGYQPDLRGGATGLAEEVTALLLQSRADGGSGTAVGALPFADGPAALRVPRQVLRAHGPLAAGTTAAGPTVPGAGAGVEATPEPAAYAAMVAAALHRLRDDDDRLVKVVLGRLLDVHLTRDVDVRTVLARLLAADPAAFVFAVGLPRNGSDARTLVGASPELLVARTGRRVSACPLAGSAPRSADPAEDHRRGLSLLASAKDLAEHAVVADAVRSALAPLCTRLDVPAVPQLRATATLWHLASKVTGVLADPATTSLHLLAALHPTPAVGGVPVRAALDVIAELEPFDREFFTGSVGWCDADGDGEWAVTIRCAEVAGPRAKLFAGAGIVAASDPDGEVAETAAKFRTVLACLGLDA